MRPRSPFAIQWSETAPRTTPDGLADPAAAVLALGAAADTVRARYGATDVAWGTVYRLRRDGLDYAASGADGAYGVFRVMGFSQKDPDGKFAATGGTSWVAAIEFARPVRAVSLIGYGNASRAGSPHRTDQLALFARKGFKPVWRTRAEIEKHLEKRERF
jgi:acyl-homoserine-lactone acylase